MDKKGREYVLKDNFDGGIVGTSDVVQEMGSFGQCLVEGVNDDGLLYVRIQDEHHQQYGDCIVVPPEGVYLHGNGNMQMYDPTVHVMNYADI